MLTAAAGSVWLSALNVQYRDVRYVVPFVIQLWMFASPVILSVLAACRIDGGRCMPQSDGGVIRRVPLGACRRVLSRRDDAAFRPGSSLVALLHGRGVLPPPRRHIRRSHLMSATRPFEPNISASATASGARRRQSTTAREAIAGAVSATVRSSAAATIAPASDEILWALDDVSFEVQPGETVGIIGRNGAGKSTLLKILSQITEPTTGFAEVTGRVGSLLEVGTGFHADLTGRENTYLNGAILGMKRAEIDRKFDEIVAFAEVDRFIDTPVKFYSSGMYMRLAFAVAAHLETEILVVDEVLAVGDMQFQKKCLGKMDDIARHGRTVLFISHNMEAIQRLCTRGMLLERGHLTASGSIHDVVRKYRTVERRLVDIGRFSPRGRRGTGWARIKDLRLVDDDRQAGGRPARRGRPDIRDRSRTRERVEVGRQPPWTRPRARYSFRSGSAPRVHHECRR